MSLFWLNLISLSLIAFGRPLYPHETINNHHRPSQLWVKPFISDVDRKTHQLNNDRDEYHKKLNQKNKAHSEHVQKLQNEINIMNKELQSTERIKEDIARNSQIAADSLHKTLSEYSSERESLNRLHCDEKARKDKQIQELTQTVGRQQERLHNLMDTKKQNENENSKLKQHIRNLKHDLSRNNGDILRLSQDLKECADNENSVKKKKNKMDQMYINLESKYDNIVADLSVITAQRDEYKKSLNQLKYDLNDSGMEKNKFMVKYETAMEMNEALKSELDNLRRKSISVHKYNESSQKCNKLNDELSECYNKIEKLSLALDSTKCDLNKLSLQSMPINAYEHLSNNVTKLEEENMKLTQKNTQIQIENDNLNDKIIEKNIKINSYKATQQALREQSYTFKKSINDLSNTNKEMNYERNNMKKKYKKIKSNLDEMSAVTQINQDLVRSNKFLRNELTSLIFQNPTKFSRECANPKCNKPKGTYLKIHPNTLKALKKACTL